MSPKGHDVATLMKRLRAWKKRCRKLNSRIEKLTSLHGEQIVESRAAYLMTLGSYLETVWSQSESVEVWKYGDAEYREDEPFVSLHVVTKDGMKRRVGKTLQSVLALYLGITIRCYACQQHKPPDAFVQRPDKRMDCCLKCHAGLKRARKKPKPPDPDKLPTSNAG